MFLISNRLYLNLYRTHVTYGHLIGEERKVLDLAAEAGDEVTVSLMSDYLKEQEKMVWMLTAFSSKTCGK